MIDVTIYSRPHCRPCDAAFETARRAQARTPFHLERVDISGDLRLLQRYGERIPVVLIEGRERFAGNVPEPAFRWAVRGARWRRPVSRILSRVKQCLTRR